MTVESKNCELNASDPREHDLQEAIRNILSDSGVVIQRNTNSYKNRVYKVLLRNGDSYIVKFFTQNGSRILAKEVQCINLLRQASDLVPVPTVLDTGTHGDLRYCILQVIGDMDASHQGITVLNKTELAQQLGECCGLIHAISQDLSATTIPAHYDWSLIIRSEYYAYVESIRRKTVLPEAQIRRLDLIFQESSELFRLDRMASFIHDDLVPANIRLACRANGIFQLAGVIDFELARWGDPLRDFTKIQWTLDTLSLSMEDFLARYTAHINMQVNFERRLICYGILSRLKHLAMADDYPLFHTNGDIIRVAREKINYYLKRLEDT